MRWIIVEPSPLARNLYRLLVLQAAPDAVVQMLASPRELGDVMHASPVTHLIIGSGALVGLEERYRALLTDAEPWCALPKLILISFAHQRLPEATWDLPHATRVPRPFRPEAFIELVTQGLAPGAPKRARRA